MKFINVIKVSIQKVISNFYIYLIVLGLAEFIAYLLMRLTSFTLFEYILKRTGMSGINNENAMQLLKQPLSLVLLLIFIVSISIVAIFQMLIIFNLSTSKISISNIFKPLIRIKVSDIKYLILYTLLILPFSNMGITLYFISNFRIPEFILNEIVSSTILSLINNIIFAGVGYLGIRYFYTFIIFCLEDVGFKEAMDQSYEYTKGKILRVIGYVVAVATFGFVTILLLGGLYFVFAKIISVVMIFEKLLTVLFASVMLIIAVIIITMSSSLLLQMIIVSYNTDESESVIIKHKIPFQKLVIPVSILSLMVYCLMIYPSAESFEGLSIVSHRGLVDHAIENTIESLEAAHQVGVDYVEFDVQQLNDGEIIVMHDNNFKRLSHVNKKVGSVGWDEVSKYKLKDRNMESKIPRFNEYLRYARQYNQKLLIEIKTNPTDSSDFIQSIIDTVNIEGMSQQVIYHSLNKQAILKVKELNESAYTGYIIGVNIGGLEDLNVDFYSIDQTSVTNTVVRDIAKFEKDLYIWSVNTEDIIQSALLAKPSGIIADDVKLVISVRDRLIDESLYRMLWRLGI